MEVTEGQNAAPLCRGTCGRVCPSETVGGQKTVVSHLEASSSTEASHCSCRSQELHRHYVNACIH